MKNILFEAQQQVADILNEQLSASVPFIAENIKDIEYQIKNALGKQGIVAVVMTPTAVFLGTFEDKDIVYELPDFTVTVMENVIVNRSKEECLTAQDTAIETANVLSDPKSLNFLNFLLVKIQTLEEDGILVSKVTFKVLIKEHNE